MDHKDLPDGTVLLKALPGEEVVSALTAFAQSRGLYAGSFQAIGAASEAVIGYWDPERRVYEKTTLTGILEIVSLLGNLSRGEDGKSFVHAHAVLTGTDCLAKGGHLFSAVAHPTCEIALRPSAGAVERRLDEACGLRLWRL